MRILLFCAKNYFMKISHAFLICICLFLANSNYAQSTVQKDTTSLKKTLKKVVQITGMTVSGDSLSPVPFANVLLKGNYSGTIADFSGFFSIVATAGDTLIFSSVGYKRNSYIIPDSLESKQYSLIQIMDRDTVMLEAAHIKNWPTYEQFKKAFLNTEVPDNDLVRAEKNLDKGSIREQARNLSMGVTGNQKLMLDNYRSQLYFAGQLPPNNLLNPIAWMKFIKAWREGKLGDQ